MLPSTQIVFPIALTTTMGLKFLSTAGLQLCHILGLLTSEELQACDLLLERICSALRPMNDVANALEYFKK